jgi:UDPglucose--hexose-1-phosphate uridylyltransferase
MKVSQNKLSDGRDLFYFDRVDTIRNAADDRSLEKPKNNSVMRQDELSNEWVLIASARQDRVFMPSTESCPLCPTSEYNKSEIPDENYDLVVFENRFASLSRNGEVEGAQDIPGYGQCEVVSFSSDHETPLAFLGYEKIKLYIEALQHRTGELSRDPRIKYIFAFENRGERVGVTMSHPHGQIYAYPFVPPRAKSMIDAEKNLKQEMTSLKHQENVGPKERTLLVSDHWQVFVPYAARWPFEVHIFPRREVGLITDLSPQETSDLALTYGAVLGAFENLFESNTAYIASWIQSPVNCDSTLSAMHIEIASPQRGVDKFKYLAGSESGMGTFINDISPETAAEALRPLTVAAFNDLRRKND